MTTQDPLSRSKWNTQAGVIIVVLVAFLAMSGWGLYLEKLDWKEWFNGMLPVLTMAVGWLLRDTTTTKVT